MYDSLSDDYDRLVNWAGRLDAEIPFLEKTLAGRGVHTVLDAACGTGQHAIALARRGFALSAADPSAGMIARARASAEAAHAEVRFAPAGFGEMGPAFGPRIFDALLCLGNSLPHVSHPAGLAAALEDFAACLRPGGVLILQNRNFDRVLSRHDRWMEPQSRNEGGREWLFLRFYDFEADGSLTFHVITLFHEAAGAWNQNDASVRLWPLREEELAGALAQAGFEIIGRFGSVRGEPFDREASPDLILTAQTGS
jgi:glycine/sarcosine N-methyltransferase